MKLEYELSSRPYNSKLMKTYRNPLIFAMELEEEMTRDGLSQADLDRKHGISRARVHQWLSILQLTEREKRRILSMGDHWKQRLLTERGLRELPGI